MSGPERTTSLRRDAQRNRAALVDAAEVEFALSGPDVPLDAVVRRAAVGRGTLYRHFTGRLDLAVAVFERYVAAHEAFVAEHPHDPDLLFTLLGRVVRIQARTRGVTLVLSREPDGDAHVARIADRMRTLFDVAITQGRAAGLVAPDITADDVMLVLGMLEGALVGVPPEQADAVAHRVLALVTPALRGGAAT